MLSGNVRNWEQKLAVMPSEYDTQKNPFPFQRCAHYCFRVNTKHPTLLPPGKYLALISYFKRPCPPLTSPGIFFSSIYKQLPSFCNEYIAKYTGDQNTSSITYQVWDVLILHSFFQLDLYLNLSIILLVPIFKACSIKLTIDLEILKLLLAAVQQEQAMHMLLFASRIDFSVQ